MEEIAIHLYPRGGRPTTAEARAVDVIRSRLESFTKHLRRVGTRLDQVVNARGKLDQVCRVEVALVKILDAPKLCVEGRASTAQEAADLAADAVEGAVRREVEAAKKRALRNRKHKATRERAERAARAKARLAAGPRLLEVRRPGIEAGLEGLEEEESETEAIAPLTGQPAFEELERSEAARDVREEEAKARRHSTPRRVKTAHPQRGRHIHKTQRQARATSAREVSATRPTRKSTRKSANRSKRDSNQARRTEREVRSSGAAAARSAARSQRGVGRIAPRP